MRLFKKLFDWFRFTKKDFLSNETKYYSTDQPQVANDSRYQNTIDSIPPSMNPMDASSPLYEPFIENSIHTMDSTHITEPYSSLMDHTNNFGSFNTDSSSFDNSSFNAGSDFSNAPDNSNNF